MRDPIPHGLGGLLSVLSSARRLQLWLQLILMMFSAVAEMAALGAIVPFLALLASPEGNLFTLPFIGVRMTIAEASVVFIIVTITSMLVRVVAERNGIRLTYNMGGDLAREVFYRTLCQPYTWHVGKNTSDVLGGVNKVTSIVSGVLNPLMQGAIAVLSSIAIVITLTIVDYQTALTAAGLVGGLYVTVSLNVRAKMIRNGVIIADSENRRIKAIQEGLGGIRDVIIDGSEPFFTESFDHYNRNLRAAQAANNLNARLPRYFIEASGLVLVVILANVLSSGPGGLTGAIPILGALALGAQRLLPQLQLIYAAWSGLKSNGPQLRDVLELVTLPLPSEEGSTEALPVPIASAPLIALRDVSYAYAHGGQPVLSSINLNICSGERIGFIGKTGCGKSTLIDIIMGLLNPVSGAVEIDGLAMTLGNRRRWQRRLAHVPQSIFLADTTIAKNIAFGTRGDSIDMIRLQRAADMAQLTEFILGLPEGFDTLVGERGVRLSGGQRQRIGLARALYRDVDVLILDEATSALDDATEAAVMNEIDALDGTRTLLMIAHRLSTLRHCDWIVEMKEGEIVRIARPADILTY